MLEYFDVKIARQKIQVFNYNIMIIENAYIRETYKYIHTYAYTHVKIAQNKEIESELGKEDKEGGKRKCETTCRVGAKVLMRSCRSESIQLCGGGG